MREHKKARSSRARPRAVLPAQPRYVRGLVRVEDRFSPGGQTPADPRYRPTALRPTSMTTPREPLCRTWIRFRFARSLVDRRRVLSEPSGPVLSGTGASSVFLAAPLPSTICDAVRLREHNPLVTQIPGLRRATKFSGVSPPVNGTQAPLVLPHAPDACLGRP